MDQLRAQVAATIDLGPVGQVAGAVIEAAQHHDHADDPGQPARGEDDLARAGGKPRGPGEDRDHQRAGGIFGQVAAANPAFEARAPVGQRVAGGEAGRRAFGGPLIE